MKKHFLKTIYFDHSQLGKKENIEKMYEKHEKINMLEKLDTTDKYIKNIEAFQSISELNLEKSITYFVWENGSGKSTLIEHIAQNFWFNKQWGTKNTLFQTNKIDNIENSWLRLSWQPQKFHYWYFFRGETVYSFADYLQNLEDADAFSPYGWENLHNFSHGQQFMKIFEAQMDKVWFYILDEIESALSPANQLKVVEIIKYMVSKWSQFIIATHSPIILGIFQDSQILSLDHWYIHEIDYDMVPCVDMYRRILAKK